MQERVRQLFFNFVGMQQGARVGVTRAAAFLGLSERFLQRKLPRSLTLGKGIQQQFLPDPISDELAAELKDNWRTWIIGNALREMDQFLSLFMDDCFDIVEMCRIVRGDAPLNHSWKRISRETNVAKKHQLVLRAANRFTDIHRQDYECLLSLSRVRNCLSHDLGRVTADRAPAGTLVARWLALRLYIHRGDEVILITQDALPWENDGEIESRVVVKVEEATKEFSVGTLVEFAADELLQICQFYNIVIDRVTADLQNLAVESGVKFDNVASDEAR